MAVSGFGESGPYAGKPAYDDVMGEIVAESTALGDDVVVGLCTPEKIELSGGVTLDRVPELAATGADYVSVGALTHSARAADLSFELEPDVNV